MKFVLASALMFITSFAFAQGTIGSDGGLICEDITDKNSGVIINVRHRYQQYFEVQIIKNLMEISFENCTQSDEIAEKGIVEKSLAREVLTSYNYKNNCRLLNSDTLAERAKEAWRLSSLQRDPSKTPYYKVGDLVFDHDHGYSKDGFDIQMNLNKGKRGQITIKAAGADKTTDFKMDVNCI